MTDMSLSRRQAVAGLSRRSRQRRPPGCAPAVARRRPPSRRARPTPRRCSIRSPRICSRLSPESATSLGIDKGKRAALRSPARRPLPGRPGRGSRRCSAPISPRADALDLSALTPSTRTSVEVVRSAYRTALDGFALPYGDVAVGGWRNTPYVVIQNVGAYLDMPRFLDTDHLIENAADAEPISRAWRSYPTQLDGELGRVRGRRGARADPARVPDRQGDHAARAASAKSAREGGALVESIDRRTKDIPGQLGSARRAHRHRPGRRRRSSARSPNSSRSGRWPRTTRGMWARPRGDELLRLGAARDHHDAHDARRNPPAGPRRS